jgi:outer membrane protein assembly factor BamE
MAMKKSMPRSLVRAAALLLPLLAGCTEVPTIPGFTPFRMEIQQGNFVDQEMVSRLKPGMSRDQVRFILGTPLVADVFHADRWDYVFSRRPQNGKQLEQRRLSVFFEDNKLKHLDGDVVPSGTASEGSTK